MCRMRRVVLSALFLSLAASMAAAAEPGFVRGPFLQDVTPTSVWLCWTTHEVLAAEIIVRGEDNAILQRIDVPAARGAREVQIADLRSGVRYRYEFTLSDGARAEGSIRTAPPPGTPLRFGVWGDSRSNPEVCQRIADRMLADDLPMVVHSGDFLRQGRLVPDTWDAEFFRPAANLMRHATLFAVIGNHEYGGPADGPEAVASFRAQFRSPGNERYYSFRYGDVHFCVLDSDRDDEALNYVWAGDGPREWRADSPQYLWAQHDLLNATAPWKIVVMHRPLYVSGYKVPNRAMRALYAPLFARAGVDLMITGDEHNFQVSRPIRHLGEPLQQRPYYHLISAGGGAPTYAVRDDEIYSAQQRQVHHYVRIEIDGGTLQATAIDVDGDAFAKFTIDHDAPADDAIPYELVCLAEHLRYTPFLDATTPFAGLDYLKAGDARTLALPIPNPMPGSAEVEISFEPHADWDIAPARQVVPLAPLGQEPAVARIRVTSRTGDMSADTPLPNFIIRAAGRTHRVSTAYTGSPTNVAANLNLATPSSVPVLHRATPLSEADAHAAATWHDVTPIERFWFVGQGMRTSAEPPPLRLDARAQCIRDPHALWIRLETTGRPPFDRLEIAGANGRRVRESASAGNHDAPGTRAAQGGVQRWDEASGSGRRVILLRIDAEQLWPEAGPDAEAPFNIYLVARKATYALAPATSLESPPLSQISPRPAR